MKKNYSFYLVLLAIPLFSFLFLGYSSGQTGQYSGSPGDGGTTCTVCHSPGANYDADPLITTDIPPSGYVAGETYSITVSVASSSTRHGFQITSENSSDAKVGTFTAGTGSQTANSDHLVTHTSAGNTQTAWVFQWTAPAVSEGDITFYAVVNATDANYTDTNDQVVTTTETVGYTNLSLAEENSLTFVVFPNPTSEYLLIQSDFDLTDKTEITLTNSLGQLIDNIKIADFNRIDVSNLTAGVYFINISLGNKKGITKFIKK
jgi:hypothetical protein